jgi:hypothetical protein
MIIPLAIYTTYYASPIPIGTLEMGDGINDIIVYPDVVIPSNVPAAAPEIAPYPAGPVGPVGPVGPIISGREGRGNGNTGNGGYTGPHTSGHGPGKGPGGNGPGTGPNASAPIATLAPTRCGLFRSPVLRDILEQGKNVCNTHFEMMLTL